MFLSHPRSGRCRQTFRGHVDSVNSVCWQPFTNNVCTGSGDKTVSLWDARTGLCAQTFYGHLNAVAGIAVSARGEAIASCDADGVVKVRWPGGEWRGGPFVLSS